MILKFFLCFIFSMPSFLFSEEFTIKSVDPEFITNFMSEPEKVALTPVLNFQIGEQFINQIFKETMKENITLGTGQNSISFHFDKATIDFEQNWCQIKFLISVTYTLLGQTNTVYIPFEKVITADQIKYEINTCKMYVNLNEYNNFLNYLQTNYSSLPSEVKTQLSSYFTKYYFYPKQLAVHFSDKLKEIDNDQVIDELPLFWENRRTELSCGFNDDYAALNVSVFMEKENPKVEIWQRVNNNQLEIRVVTNIKAIASIQSVASGSTPTSGQTYRFDNSRHSRYIMTFTAPNRSNTSTIGIINSHLNFSYKCNLGTNSSTWCLVVPTQADSDYIYKEYIPQ